MKPADPVTSVIRSSVLSALTVPPEVSPGRSEGMPIASVRLNQTLGFHRTHAARFILRQPFGAVRLPPFKDGGDPRPGGLHGIPAHEEGRSEERRVGKGGRSRG